MIVSGLVAVLVWSPIRGRKGWRRPIAAGLLLLLAGWTLRMTDRVRHDGLWAAVPTTALIASVPWLPGDVMYVRDNPYKLSDWHLMARRSTMWDWQRRWMERRMVSRIPASASVESLAEAEPLLGFAGDQYGQGVAGVALAGIADPDLAVREASARTLWDYYTSGKVCCTREFQAYTAAHPEHVPALISALGDSSWHVSNAAADALGFFGDAARPALPRLFEHATRDLESWRTYGARRSLGMLARSSPLVRSDLIEIAESGETAERLVAVEALGSLVRNQEDREATAVLTRLVDAPEILIACAAARELGYKLEHWNRLLPVLFQKIKSNEENRAELLRALPEASDLLLPYVPRVLARVSDRSPEVRGAAANVLKRIATYRGRVPGPEAIPRLRQLCTDEDATVRDAAAAALRALGEVPP